MKIPIRNVYYLLCYAWGHAEETDLVDVAALGRLDETRDLLAKVLAEGTFRLLRRGIDRDYRETTREIAGVRGKLEVGAMATRAVRAKGRTICTFERFSQDVLHNRILRSTLDALLRSGELDSSVQRDVALAHRKLEGIEVIRLSRQLFNRVQLDRNQRIYRFLLSVCRLVHDSLLMDERTGELEFVDFRRDEKQMWRVFEDFTLEFFRREQERYRVVGQAEVPWFRAEGRTRSDASFIPGMRSDIVLESSDRRIILDTKFYEKPLSRRYGAEKLRSNNLYQLLTYLENRQASLPRGPRHDGILLYAAVEKSFRVEVGLQGFRVQARTVDLSRPWAEIREEMLEAVGVTA